MVQKIYIGYQGSLPVRVETSREIIENDLFLRCDRIAEHEGRAEIVGGAVLFDEDIDTAKVKVATESRISELQSYLDSTDWYVVRYADTGEAMPADVKAQRQAAREEISTLRGNA